MATYAQSYHTENETNDTNEDSLVV